MISAPCSLWTSINRRTSSTLLLINPKSRPAETVTLYRFLFDLHFGYGLLSRKWSTWINDFGGIALSVLALTGFLAWYLKRRWRRAGFRLGQIGGDLFCQPIPNHAPVIGVLGVVPFCISLSPAFFLITFLPSSSGEKHGRCGASIATGLAVSISERGDRPVVTFAATQIT